MAGGVDALLCVGRRGRQRSSQGAPTRARVDGQPPGRGRGGDRPTDRGQAGGDDRQGAGRRDMAPRRPPWAGGIAPASPARRSRVLQGEVHDEVGGSHFACPWNATKGASTGAGRTWRAEAAAAVEDGGRSPEPRAEGPGDPAVPQRLPPPLRVSASRRVAVAVASPQQDDARPGTKAGRARRVSATRRHAQ